MKFALLVSRKIPNSMANKRISKEKNYRNSSYGLFLGSLCVPPSLLQSHLWPPFFEARRYILRLSSRHPSLGMTYESNWLISCISGYIESHSHYGWRQLHHQTTLIGRLGHAMHIWPRSAGLRRKVTWVGGLPLHWDIVLKEDHKFLQITHY